MCYYLSILDIILFISYDQRTYHRVDELVEIEEFYPSINKIFFTLNSLHFTSQYKLDKKKVFWGVLNSNKDENFIFSNQIKFNRFVDIFEKNVFLFKVFSSNISLKLIMKLGV